MLHSNKNADDFGSNDMLLGTTIALFITSLILVWQISAELFAKNHFYTEAPVTDWLYLISSVVAAMAMTSENFDVGIGLSVACYAVYLLLLFGEHKGFLQIAHKSRTGKWKPPYATIALFVSVVLLTSYAMWADSEKSCKMEISEMKQCGKDGITTDMCVDCKDCCWNYTAHNPGVNVTSAGSQIHHCYKHLTPSEDIFLFLSVCFILLYTSVSLWDASALEKKRGMAAPQTQDKANIEMFEFVLIAVAWVACLAALIELDKTAGSIVAALAVCVALFYVKRHHNAGNPNSFQPLPQRDAETFLELAGEDGDVGAAAAKAVAAASAADKAAAQAAAKAVAAASAADKAAAKAAVKAANAANTASSGAEIGRSVPPAPMYHGNDTSQREERVPLRF